VTRLELPGWAIVREVAYAEVHPFQSLAAREGVSAKDSQNGDLWLGIHHPGAGLVSFGALHRRFRVKATWTRPDFRGIGLGTAIVDALIAAAPPESAVQVIARDPAWWLARGWTATNTRPNGGTVLRANREDHP
jgi:GNAT superfamily N-acetyltransferase